MISNITLYLDRIDLLTPFNLAYLNADVIVLLKYTMQIPKQTYFYVARKIRNTVSWNLTMYKAKHNRK